MHAVFELPAPVSRGVRASNALPLHSCKCKRARPHAACRRADQSCETPKGQGMAQKLASALVAMTRAAGTSLQRDCGLKSGSVRKDVSCEAVLDTLCLPVSICLCAAVLYAGRQETCLDTSIEHGSPEQASTAHSGTFSARHTCPGGSELVARSEFLPSGAHQSQFDSLLPPSRTRPSMARAPALDAARRCNKSPTEPLRHLVCEPHTRSR